MKTFCSFGSGYMAYIIVHDFVKFSSDSKLVTNDSGFLMIPPLCRTDCFQLVFNGIVHI